eukprot:s56_g38.t1
MENFTNVTLVEALQTATGQSERTLTNVGAMMLTYVFTCCAGTLILMLAGQKAARGEKVPLLEDGVKDDTSEQPLPQDGARASVGSVPTPETVGLATHDLVVHVDSPEPIEPKKEKKKKIVTKKKAQPAKSSKSKHSPDSSAPQSVAVQQEDAASAQQTRGSWLSSSDYGDSHDPEQSAVVAQQEGTTSAQHVRQEGTTSAQHVRGSWLSSSDYADSHDPEQSAVVAQQEGTTSAQHVRGTLFSSSCASDSRTPELHAVTPEEGADSAEPTPGSQSARGLRKVPWWVTYRKWWVIAAFSCTYLLCLAAALGSMATGQLSKERGLAWEFYTGLFACGCLWMLVQAVLAAVWLPNGKRYAATAFVEATIGGVSPFLSDAFDTMKDILFGALCLMADNWVVKMLGGFTFGWLIGFHAHLLDDTHCQLEFAANHLAVLAMPTLDAATSSEAPAKADDADDAGEANKDCCVTCKQWCINKASLAWSEALPVIYKQLTPTKRKMLVWENLPQAVIAIVYLILVGDSPVVAVLNLAIPLLQVILALVLFKPVQRRIAPKLARRIDAALEASDLQQLQRLREEAQLDQDVELFRLICLQSIWLVDFVKDDQETKRRESWRKRPSVQAALKESLRFCSRCLDALDSGVLDVSEELQGNERRFKGVVAIVSLDMEPLQTLKMNNNDISLSWAKELGAGLSKNNSLMHIDLSGNVFAVEGMKALARGLKDKSLQSLVLTGNDLGAEGAKVVMEIKTESLHLANNNLKNEGVEALAAGLHDNKTLVELDLAGNSIGAEGTQVLSRALVHNSTLRRLSLEHNHVEDAGAQAIGEGLQENTGLVKLILNDNEIGDPGGEALAEALQTNKTLKVLHIQLNKLGDLGCKALDRQSGALEELDMEDNEGEAWLEEDEKDSSLLPDITLAGHTNFVRSVCRLNATTLASTSDDNTVKIWEWPSGRCVRTLAGHTDTVRGVCRLNATTLASASDDNKVKIWEWPSGRCVHTLAGHTSWVQGVCRLDASTLASASDDRTVKIWEWPSGRCMHTLAGHTNYVEGVCRLNATTLASANVCTPSQATPTLYGACAGLMLPRWPAPATTTWSRSGDQGCLFRVTDILAVL